MRRSRARRSAMPRVTPTWPGGRDWGHSPLARSLQATRERCLLLGISRQALSVRHWQEIAATRERVRNRRESPRSSPLRLSIESGPRPAPPSLTKAVRSLRRLCLRASSFPTPSPLLSPGPSVCRWRSRGIVTGAAGREIAATTEHVRSCVESPRSSALHPHPPIRSDLPPSMESIPPSCPPLSASRTQ